MHMIMPRKENTADGSFEPTRMLLLIVRPYLFEFMFLGSGGSLFLKIGTHYVEKKKKMYPGLRARNIYMRM